MNIVLIGMPGSGKSTLGKRAARALGMEFLDTDVLIEEHEMRPITEIFKVDGEAYFRDLETLTIETVMKTAKVGTRVGQEGETRGFILSVGGGAAESSVNAEFLHRIGKVIFIDRPLEALEKSIAYNGNRPLLSDRAKLVELYERRRPIYLEVADRVIANGGDFEAASYELVLTTKLMGAGADYFVIGDPIAHTLSPRLHGAVFEELLKMGISVYDVSYGAIKLAKERLESAISDIRSGTLRGLNVTIPHKKAIIPLLDEVRGDAEVAGAVNTVVREDGRLVGYNTDMEGLNLAIQASGRTYQGAVVTVCGTGGAAAGIVSKASAEGAALVYIIGRNEEAAARVIASARAKPAGRTDGDEANGDVPCIIIFVRHDFEDTVEPPHFVDALAGTNILINATPLGMEGTGKEFASFSFLEKLPTGAFIYDIVYNPRETALVCTARERGIAAEGGLSMLVYQGILSDELFLGMKLDRKAIYEAVWEKI
ncbi:MAG: AAA family ATPase [Clostridiales Family XIII bacterium]|nr:AAA family ATPase [Clostridiales Family XIII bacterium]